MERNNRNDDILVLQAYVGNYYGRPQIRQDYTGRWFFNVTCEANGDNETRVTPEFAEAFIKEFGIHKDLWLVSTKKEYEERGILIIEAEIKKEGA